MVGLKWLKSAPYAETNYFLFLVEGEWESLNKLVRSRVGIIRKDQAKRYIQHGDLDADLHAKATADVAKLVEKALRQSHCGICLSLTAQEDLLKTKGKTGRRIEWTYISRIIQFLRGNDAIIS